MPADEPGRPAGSLLTRFALRHWIAIALVALTAVFIGQNRDRQQVRVLWITVESPVWLLLTAMLVIGVIVGLLLRRGRR